MARRCGGKHICKWKYPKTPQVRTKFGSYDVEKWHAAVAGSTFASENIQKHLRFGPGLEVTMSKNGTLLWHEAHLQGKMHKTPQARSNFSSFDLEKSHAAVARSTFASQNVKRFMGTGHFLSFRCWKVARPCGAKPICKSKIYKIPGFCHAVGFRCEKVSDRRDRKIDNQSVT